MIRPLLCAVFVATLVACTDAPTPTGPPPQGPDVQGPDLVVRPGRDTLVDSTGTLLVLVVSRDRSNIKRLTLDMIGAGFAFPPLFPNDTVFTVIFPIALNPLKNSSFEYVAPVVDVLDHETVTDPVTVTVK